MATAQKRIAELKEPRVILIRVLDAPRSVVFEAWTDPKRLAAWWGPHGFTNPACELDPRPGGVFNIDMRGPDGTVYANRGVFHEVVEPERLVFGLAVVDPKGKVLVEGLDSVTLAELEGRTKLILHGRIIKMASDFTAAAEGMEEGWSQSFERLAALLAELTASKSG